MNNFTTRLPSEPYLLVAAGSGPKNIELPDGTITSTSEVKRELGYPQLLAWKNERKELDNWIQHIRENPTCESKLIVDSSAYSAWTRGIEIDIDEYIDFINENEDAVYWFAELDKIPGKPGEKLTKEEAENAPKISWENFIYMIKRVKCPKKIVPIFHKGEDFKYLKQMLEYLFEDGSHIEYIGLASHCGSDVAETSNWYKTVWEIIRRSSNPNVLVHNFGMTILSILEQFPSQSSDSTSWLRTASFGNIYVYIKGKLKTIYVSDRNKSNPNYFYNLSKASQDAVREFCSSIGKGLTIEHLLEEKYTNARFIFNLYTLDKWRKNFIYKGNSQVHCELW